MSDERRELRGHELCLCGSGQKYRACCRPKGHQWFREGEVFPKVTHAVPMSPEVRALLLDMKRRREAELGRPVGPGDKVFPEGTIPETDEAFADEIAKGWQAARGEPMPPELHYAISKTGLLLLTEEGRRRAPPGYVQEWDAAISEYRVSSG